MFGTQQTPWHGHFPHPEAPLRLSCSCSAAVLGKKLQNGLQPRHLTAAQSSEQLDGCLLSAICASTTPALGSSREHREPCVTRPEEPSQAHPISYARFPAKCVPSCSWTGKAQKGRELLEELQKLGKRLNCLLTILILPTTITDWNCTHDKLGKESKCNGSAKECTDWFWTLLQ